MKRYMIFACRHFSMAEKEVRLQKSKHDLKSVLDPLAISISDPQINSEMEYSFDTAHGQNFAIV